MYRLLAGLSTGFLTKKNFSSSPCKEPIPCVSLVLLLALLLTLFRFSQDVPGIKMMAKNLMVKALAGTGKTSTMVWSVGRVPRNMTLSDEQVAIRDWVQAQKIDRYRFLAFNKAIATELSKKVPANCEASTCHSSGLGIIKMNHGRGIKVDSWKYRKVMDRLFGEPKKSEDYVVRNTISKVLDLARANMLGYEIGGVLELAPGDIQVLQESFDIEGELTTDQLLDYSNKTLAAASNDFKVVDFGDMIWMPVFHQMKCSKIDGLIVDECQDLNRAQQGLVMMQSDQVICVGDVNQAIYGFAGADSISMGRLEEMLVDRGGVDILPLTMTRRCGKKIVEQAKKLVPAYRAADENPEGEVRNIQRDALIEELRAVAVTDQSTMVLCRTNAPLVSLAFRLLRQEVKVVIRGRDIGQGLIKLVEKMAGKSNNVDKMINALNEYASQEETKILRRYKYGVEEKLIALNDKVDCIRVLSGDCKTTNDLINKLGRLFQDNTDIKDTIVLSSVHKAKGLEADRVYIFKPHLLPHPKLIDKANGLQEWNLKYVAETRAIHVLSYVIESTEE